MVEGFNPREFILRYMLDGEQMSMYDAAVKYKEAGVPLLVVAGKEYGTGSSRDWAAKGTLLLGVRAVLAGDAPTTREEPESGLWSSRGRP